MNAPAPLINVPLGFEDDEPLPARDVARRYTTFAIRALIAVANQNEDLPAKAKAAQALLDRGWGRPEQQTNVTATGTMTVQVAWATAERLSYSRPIQPVEVIEAEPQPQAWKDTGPVKDYKT